MRCDDSVRFFQSAWSSRKWLRVNDVECTVGETSGAEMRLAMLPC